MWFERHLIEVKPRAFTVDGSSYGLVQVADIRGFFVKQTVVLTSDTQPSLQVEIKRFDSPTSFYVGKKGENIDARVDVSAYKVSENAAIAAPRQPRPGITLEHIDRASYEEEPILAKRVIQVDDRGEHYGVGNPMPVKVITTSPVPVQVVNDVNSGLAPPQFDHVIIDKNSRGEPITYTFFLDSVQVGVIDVIYDPINLSISYKRTS